MVVLYSHLGDDDDGAVVVVVGGGGGGGGGGAATEEEANRARCESIGAGHLVVVPGKV